MVRSSLNRPRLVRTSIIIPLESSDPVAASQFDDTLASILRNRPASSQIIVAHDGSYSDPFGLADEVDFVSTERKPHLIRLLNCGLRVATGQFIVTLRPGVELSDGWDEVIDSAFKDPKIASVSPALVCPTNPAKMIAGGVEANFGLTRMLCGEAGRMTEKSTKRISPVGPTSWAAFYRRDALDEVGSFDETLDPVYVDLDVALALRSLGYRCAFRPQVVANVALPKRILREAQSPHGRSAQRAMRRHSNGMNPILRGALAVSYTHLTLPTTPYV